MKYRDKDTGETRYSIRPVEAKLTFDKVREGGTCISGSGMSIVRVLRVHVVLLESEWQHVRYLPMHPVLCVQGFYMFVRAIQLLTQRIDGVIMVRPLRKV